MIIETFCGSLCCFQVVCVIYSIHSAAFLEGDHPEREETFKFRTLGLEMVFREVPSR